METESAFDFAVGLGYFPICLDMEFYKQLIDKRLPVERRDKAICQGERHYTTISKLRLTIHSQSFDP